MKGTQFVLGACLSVISLKNSCIVLSFLLILLKKTWGYPSNEKPEELQPHVSATSAALLAAEKKNKEWVTLFTSSSLMHTFKKVWVTLLTGTVAPSCTHLIDVRLTPSDYSAGSEY
jgi:hypothetical protein